MASSLARVLKAKILSFGEFPQSELIALEEDS